MKVLKFFLAAVASLLCLQSCNEGLLEDLVDAFAKHYYVGDEAVFVESAILSKDNTFGFDATGILLVSKDDPEKTFLIGGPEELFGKETEAKEFMIIAKGSNSNISTAGSNFLLGGELKTLAGTGTISGGRLEGTVISSGTPDAYTIKSKDLYACFTDKDGEEVKVNLNFCYIGKLDPEK